MTSPLLGRLGSVLEKTLVPGASFRFQELLEGPNAHASWWSFQDEEEVRARWWTPREGELVLDVGAAFGSYALQALARGARVVVFNPADFDAALCLHNVGLNPGFAERFAQTREGIGGKDGFFNPRLSKFADVLPPGARTNGAGGVTCEEDEWIRVRSLDSWMAERPGLGKVDWLKFDIEGAELEALRGAEQLLRQDRPKILVENHQFHHPTMEKDVANFILGLGIGYKMEGPQPYHSVSHSFFEVR